MNALEKYAANKKLATLLKEAKIEKLAWESADPEISGDKLLMVFRGSNPKTMTMAKARGLKPAFDEELGGGYKASQEITDPARKKEILADLVRKQKKAKDRRSGIFGRRPWIGKKRKKRYDFESAHLDKLTAMADKMKSAAAKKKPTKKVELEPDRLRRAMAGGMLGGGAALPAATLSALITRNPQFLKDIAKGTAKGVGAGALLGQAFPIMKGKDDGPMRLVRETKGPRKGKLVFARENE
tara:strand:+ start:69405 stop:70127 length:723 start_codon:yes stop_codon:yes gene_type:complete